MERIEKYFIILFAINIFIAIILLIISHDAADVEITKFSSKVLHFNFNGETYDWEKQIIYDLSENGNNGLLFGSPAWIKFEGPKNDGAFEFDGVDDKIFVNHVPGLSPSTTRNFTIVFWIKFKTTVFADNQDKGYINFLGKAGLNNYEFLFRQYNTSNSQRRPNRISFYLFNLEGGLGSGAYFQEPINTNEWIFITALYDGENIELWKDAILKQRVSVHQYNVMPNIGYAPLKIGTIDDKTFFSGYIDELQIYNRTLTQQEIINLYNFNYNVV